MNALTFNSGYMPARIRAGYAPSRIRLADIRREYLVTAQIRLLLLLAAFVLVAAAAMLRIAYLGVVQPAPEQL